MAEADDPPLDLKQIRRIEQRERKHRAILDAALSILETSGLDGLTMPGLAKELGVAVGGLYRWFPSKDRIVLELQGRAVDRLWRRIGHRWRLVAKPPADEGTRALALLVAALDVGMRFSQAEPLYYDLLRGLLVTPPPEGPDRDWLVTRAKPLVDGFVTHLHAAMAAEVIGSEDPSTTVAWWWASVAASQALPGIVRPAPEVVVDGLLRGGGAVGYQLLAARRLVERAEVS